MMPTKDIKYILVTGGAGYIGSHFCVELLQSSDRKVIVIDNFCNSHEEVFGRIEKITGKSVDFRRVDLTDNAALERFFDEFGGCIEAVFHFAGLKAVGESNHRPLDYYQNNVVGSLNLLNQMEKYSIKKLIYSSSATVYGDPAIIPQNETCPTQPTSPYGRTKLFVESIISDITARYNWKSVILRYFNPVGAHKSGLIGEDPQGVPNNLMPFLSQVAVGKLKELTIYGGDYFTIDGTGVRDYIHVVDLCKGHMAALDAINSNQAIRAGQAEIFNLGTGQGYSVLQMMKAFNEVIGRPLSYKVGERRQGDVATLLADPTKANDLLNWKAEFEIYDMCSDTWRWQSLNPSGLKK